MSRIPLIKSDVKEIEITRENSSKRYDDKKFDSNTFPLIYQMINKYERTDNDLVEKLKFANYHTKYFCGGRNTFMLIYKNDKIVVPTILQKYVVHLHHTYILHPGTERIEDTISQHY